MVPESIIRDLQIAACKLNLDKFDATHIKSAACEGYIETNWSAYTIGTKTGILFKSRISGERGDYFVNFLMREDDLKEGVDFLEAVEESMPAYTGSSSERLPIDELYKFLDERGSARLQ